MSKLWHDAKQATISKQSHKNTHLTKTQTCTMKTCGAVLLSSAQLDHAPVRHGQEKGVRSYTCAITKAGRRERAVVRKLLLNRSQVAIG
eukprot:2161912-Pleurochrysis_carterae.AAC.1